MITYAVATEMTEPGLYGPVFRAYRNDILKTNVGMLVCQNFKNHMFIDNLYVDVNYRGMGIASKLLSISIRHLLDFYPQLPVRLRPDPHGEIGLNLRQLIEFYERHGFKWATFDRSHYMEWSGDGNS